MLTHSDATTTIHLGDCVAIMKTLPANSVDSIITDPPYAIAADRQPAPAQPGSDSNSLTKSSSTTAERAIAQGGPSIDSEDDLRSLHDRADQPVILGMISANWHDSATHSRGYADNNNQRFQEWCLAWAQECLRVLKPGGHIVAFGGTRTAHRLACAIEDAGFEIRDSMMWLYATGTPKGLSVGPAVDRLLERQDSIRTDANKVDHRLRDESTGQRGSVPPHEAVVTTEALEGRARLRGQWAGWDTNLKPAHEHNVLARKPIQQTVAETVLEFGTGALNIDKCRIKSADGPARWPTNVFLDHDRARELDQVASEPVSRYFWSAKPGRAERVRVAGISHPTVKPLQLMRELVRLVTPPGGTVLDPFAGSGTTLEACVVEGFKSVAIEQEPAYLPLIRQRLDRRNDAIRAILTGDDDDGLFELFQDTIG